MRRLYLIGAFVIAGLLFFITKDNLGGEDSKSFTNAVRPTALQIAGFALGDDEPFLAVNLLTLSLIHISEPTRPERIGCGGVWV